MVLCLLVSFRNKFQRVESYTCEGEASEPADCCFEINLCLRSSLVGAVDSTSASCCSSDARSPRSFSLSSSMSPRPTLPPRTGSRGARGSWTLLVCMTCSCAGLAARGSVRAAGVATGLPCIVIECSCSFSSLKNRCTHWMRYQYSRV